jgi:hypothetical protein
LNFFYGTKSSIAVGSGTTAVSNTNTALANQIRFDSTPFPSGNSATWNSTTGDIVYTIKESFPVETGTVIYTEAGIRLVGGNPFGEQKMNNLSTNETGIANRVLFPGSTTLNAGEQLILTVAVTIPTLASSAGKTITIGAQNGVNISGVLKVIADTEAMVGGTITADGTPTAGGAQNNRTSYPALFGQGATPIALLSDKTAFDTLGSNPSWGTSGAINGIWGSYTNGNRFRDVGFTWGSGVPASNTDFRSILFKSDNRANPIGGYQLLLDNEMTKATTATLSLSLRFSV